MTIGLNNAMKDIAYQLILNFPAVKAFGIIVMMLQCMLKWIMGVKF